MVVCSENVIQIQMSSNFGEHRMDGEESSDAREKGSTLN